MKSLTIGGNVRVLLVVALGFTALIAFGGLWAESSLAGVVDGYGAATVPGLQSLTALATSVAQATSQGSAVENQMADEAEHRRALAALEARVSAARDAAKVLASLPAAPEVKKAQDQIRTLLDGWASNVEALRQAAKERDALADQFAQAAAKQSVVSARYQQMRQQTDALLSAIEETAQAARASADAVRVAAGGTAQTARITVSALGLLCALVLGLWGLALVRQTQRTTRTLLAETGRLEAAVAAGQLDVRADEAAVHDEFRPVVHGMNRTMEAFVAPIRLMADNVSRIGRGEIPAKITADYQGDFNLIKTSLNDCIAAVNALVADAGMLAGAGVEGRLATRADASRHQGDFRKIVQGVNDTLDAVVGPLNVAASCVERIARGDVPQRITAEYRGDFDLIKKNLNTCIEAVNALVADAGTLSRAAIAGALATRADASRHQGDFRKIVQGVNDTLDAVIKPLNVAAGYVERISRGEIPPPITDAYAGDFAKLKDSLNGCIAAVNLLVKDADLLVQAAVSGRLSTRADAAKHQGDFRKIVDGVNRTLDAVMAPIQESASTLERLAQRDLTARVSGSFQGDHARIAEAVNASSAALHEAMQQVAEAVGQVSSAASQIASSSQAVASGASEQAASLEATTASIQTVAGVTRQAADNAAQANTLARTAKDAAEAGTGAVAEMRGAMDRIRASAEGTSAIIKDINEIAFQTNLLALNAAVEAARAGEAGRGFAVVAEEVRSLALRAKEAATKTEELIRQSVKEAEAGQHSSQVVAARLGEIATGIGKVSDIVSEIAAAAKEQAAGIDQVTDAIGQMDKVTQQNAASAEESSSAASELSGQADGLSSMVAGFRLEDGRRAVGAGKPRPAALRAARARRLTAAPAEAGGADDERHIADF